MKIESTFIEGLYIITPNVFQDERGHFFESFNEAKLKENGLLIDKFVQDNESYSKYGTLRGLHFQIGESAQTKIVRTVTGSILDVAVDLRKSSTTFGQYFSLELSAENKKQLFIPKGFAHGFVVKSKDAIVQYKCDNFYNKEAESGIRFDDPDLNINWDISIESVIINDRDKNWPNFKR